MPSAAMFATLLLILTVSVRAHELCDKISELATRPTGPAGEFIEEKLFGFSGPHRNEISIGLDVHVVSGKADKEEIEKWVNFSQSRLRSDWQNTAGISFSTHVTLYNPVELSNSSSILGANIGPQAYCSLGVLDDASEFNISADFYWTYRDFNCVNPMITQPQANIVNGNCFVEEPRPITSELGCSTGGLVGYPLDMFQYNYSAAANITVILQKNRRDFVFMSQKKRDHFILREVGDYEILFYHNSTDNVAMKFDFQFKKHNCFSTEEFVQEWMDSWDVDNRMHLLLSDRIAPYTNYQTHGRIILKDYHNPVKFLEQDATYLWLHILKALDGLNEVDIPGVCVCVCV